MDILTIGSIFIICGFLFIYGLMAIFMNRKIKKELVKSLQETKERRQQVEKVIKEKESTISNTEKEIQQAKAEIERLGQELRQDQEELAKYKQQKETSKSHPELEQS